MEGEFRLRDVALTAYGPTIVSSTGHGAVMPILALRARDLGADVSTAAAIVAALGIGMLVASLPASAVVARIGERRALVYAGVLDAAAMLLGAVAGSVLLLGLSVVVSGMTWTTFLMARQGFMIEVVPLSHRARALSTLGGSHRVGVFVGPLIGAALIALGDLSTVFVFAAVAALGAAALAWTMPDLGSERRDAERERGHLGVWQVLAQHRYVLLTLGVVVVVISASRSVRTGLLPLWADHVGISATTTSLIFALAGAVDIVFFYPGGWLMDHRGRTVVAVPVVLSVAVAALLLPLATSSWSVAAVVVLIAIGNGLGSGIVMVLGADAAPADGRAQFLGGWRLCGDIGLSGGPLVVGAIALVAPLALACVVIGVLGLAGTAWTAYFVAQVDRDARAATRS
ncbi:MFS transporter [Nocardioides plantarum]|uniref:MFS transporter n=1 Tax=Nocardioides plantarum TaxID=29299 RepID=A0ABV5K4E0_9ACTN|nr:MFS transporter [Nocardioides plantarum]